MRELGQEPRLVLEHAQRMLVLRVMREQTLDHDVAKEPALPPLPSKKDLRHPAGRNLVQQLEAANAPMLHAAQCILTASPAKDPPSVTSIEPRGTSPRPLDGL